jgi:hypothetical protein
MDRNETIRRIKAALQRRSGKAWSVTGGRGTDWGWLTIEAPPARRTWGHRLKAGATMDRPEDYEGYDTEVAGGSNTPADMAELAGLLGWPDGEGRPAHHQGVSIPAGSDYWQEYIDRAEGRKPTKAGVPYWD